jgi:hypothetical protein
MMSVIRQKDGRHSNNFRDIILSEKVSKNINFFSIFVKTVHFQIIRQTSRFNYDKRPIITANYNKLKDRLLCKLNKQTVLTAFYSRDKLRTTKGIIGSFSQRMAEKDCHIWNLINATII